MKKLIVSVITVLFLMATTFALAVDNSVAKNKKEVLKKTSSAKAIAVKGKKKADPAKIEKKAKVVKNKKKTKALEEKKKAKALTDKKKAKAKSKNLVIKPLPKKETEPEKPKLVPTPVTK